MHLISIYALFGLSNKRLKRFFRFSCSFIGNGGENNLTGGIPSLISYSQKGILRCFQHRRIKRQICPSTHEYVKISCHISFCCFENYEMSLFRFRITNLTKCEFFYLFLKTVKILFFFVPKKRNNYLQDLNTKIFSLKLILSL